jgi:hypothetical protein
VACYPNSRTARLCSVHPVCRFRNQRTAFLFSRYEEAPRIPERPPADVARCGAEIHADGHRPGAARAVSSPEEFASCNCLAGFPHERGTGRDVIALHIPIGE